MKQQLLLYTRSRRPEILLLNYDNAFFFKVLETLLYNEHTFLVSTADLKSKMPAIPSINITATMETSFLFLINQDPPFCHLLLVFIIEYCYSHKHLYPCRVNLYSHNKKEEKSKSSSPPYNYYSLIVFKAVDQSTTSFNIV